MRDVCSGCGETYLDEHIDCCECGRYLCPFYLMEHRQQTGHTTRADRLEIGTDFVDLNTVVTREQLIAFSRKLEIHPEIYLAVCLVIKTAYLSANIFVTNPVTEEHRRDFRIKSQEFMALLDEKGDLSSVLKVIENQILEDARAYIKSHELPLPGTRPLFFPDKS